MRNVALYLLLVVPLLASAQNQTVAPEISPSLRTTIERLWPAARVLEANEIDMRECESVPKTPGLVIADFNGDGLEDAAMILKTHVAKKSWVSEGQTYRNAKLLFAIFLNDGKGGYLVPTKDRYDNLIPAMMFIDVIPPRNVRDINSGKDVSLQAPGVMLTFCGKSAAAYRVTGSTVKEIPLSD